MREYQDLRLKLPRRARIDAHVAQDHPLTDLVFVNMTLLRPDRKARRVAIRDAFDRDALILNALNKHWHEFAVPVWTEEHRRVRINFTTHDETTHNRTNTFHGKLIV